VRRGHGPLHLGLEPYPPEWARMRAADNVRGASRGGGKESNPYPHKIGATTEWGSRRSDRASGLTAVSYMADLKNWNKHMGCSFPAGSRATASVVGPSSGSDSGSGPHRPRESGTGGNKDIGGDRETGADKRKKTGRTGDEKKRRHFRPKFLTSRGKGGEEGRRKEAE